MALRSPLRTFRTPLATLLAAGLLTTLIAAAPAPTPDTTPPPMDAGTPVSEPLDSGTLVTDVTRIGGVDRYAVSAAASRGSYLYGARTVLVASGEKFPDALSAGPASIHLRAPLLLTAADSLPASIATEIRRLGATSIIVIGGEASITPTVFTELQKLAPSVSRLSAPDRYALSRAIARNAFVTATSAYIATGTGYADALSATPPAGMNHWPVILVDGSASSLDDATRATLRDLGVGRVTIAGGTSSVSAGIEAQLKAMMPTGRVAGADRYAASIAINQTFVHSNAVYLASGTSFPDALSGGAAAGSFSSPLYIIPPTCVPPAVLHEIVRLGATDVLLLGGVFTLDSDVEKLTPCL